MNLKKQKNILHPEVLEGFFKSTNFSTAIIVALALTIPILLGRYFDVLPYGILITLGAILASPSDIAGSMRLKISGILLSTALAMVVTFISHFLHFSPWIFVPIMGIMMFLISYLSIYGFRASLISFSGLFAFVINLSSLGESDFSVIQQTLLIGVGGLWYLALAISFYLIFPKVATEESLSKAFKLTSKYLQIRAQLIEPSQQRTSLSKDLLTTQTDLTEKHEKLRELLLNRRKGSGKSNYQTRSLSVFIELIDMLELAVTNPVNYEKADLLFKNNPTLFSDFQSLLFGMSDQLEIISNNLNKPNQIPENKHIKNLFIKLENDIDSLRDSQAIVINEDIILLKNFLKYQNLQFQKIDKIERILKNTNQKELHKVARKDFSNYLTQPNYNLELIIENFSFNSAIFRHSLRIAVVTMIGYLIGVFFNLQNSYWILLTIIVIMRPAYGLTKSRSRQRVIGTLIGGFVAVGIVFLVHNTYVFAVLAVLSLIIAFTMFQSNYKAAAAFVTLNVVFVYALLEPNVLHVIQYRIIDTLIGTGLAVVGNLILWPAWEIKSIEKTLLETIRANRNYLNQIVSFYNKGGELTQEYRLSRKKAFLEMSELSASFQRMTQEPKFRQGQLQNFYELSMLNHNFLVATASFGTYIVHNPTTPASENFNKVMDYIDENFQIAENFIQNKSSLRDDRLNSLEVMEATFGRKSDVLTSINDFEELDFDSQVEEAHLVLEQLKWLLDISEKIVRTLEKTEF